MGWCEMRSLLALVVVLLLAEPVTAQDRPFEIDFDEVDGRLCSVTFGGDGPQLSLSLTLDDGRWSITGEVRNAVSQLGDLFGASRLSQDVLDSRLGEVGIGTWVTKNVESSLSVSERAQLSPETTLTLIISGYASVTEVVDHMPANFIMIGNIFTYKGIYPGIVKFSECAHAAFDRHPVDLAIEAKFTVETALPGWAQVVAQIDGCTFSDHQDKVEAMLDVATKAIFADSDGEIAWAWRIRQGLALKQARIVGLRAAAENLCPRSLMLAEYTLSSGLRDMLAIVSGGDR